MAGIVNRKLGNQGSKKKNKRSSSGQRPLDYQQLETRALLAAAFVPNELLVQFAPHEDVASRIAVRQKVGGDLLQAIHTQAMIDAGVGTLDRISIGGGLTVNQAIAQVRSLSGVVYAEPNWIYTHSAISNDTHYTNGNLWGVFSNDTPNPIGPSGTTNQFGSQAEKVWNNGQTGSNTVYIGVIDEGIDFNHPDLNANIWTNPFDPADGVDNDGNGRIDDIRGWDFDGGDNSIYDGPSDDHGTHVAGTIGAVGGNSVGVAGINWNVTMISVKLLGNGGGTTANAVLAFDYITDLKTRHGLNIVATNNSWGGGGNSQALLDAIARSGTENILCIAAAGNSNSNNDSTPFYPASHSTLGIIGYESVVSVAAIESGGDKSSFSSYGATSVDLGAPGSDIWSTLPENTYGSFSGTSMAAPHVAGAVALYASVNTGSTASQIRDALLNSVTLTSSMTGITVTGGRLDAAKLVPVLGPKININDVTVTEGNTGTLLATFTVTLAETSTDTITVDYATAAGTATPGSDFDAKTGTLTFAPSELIKTISIVVRGDFAFEPNETFFVNLSNPVNGNLGDGSGRGTIVNDDSKAIGEAGNIVGLTSTWKTIVLQRPYVNPVVIMGTPSKLAADPVTVRVRNVRPAVGTTPGSFEVRIDEWEYQDGIHGKENVSYVVIEAGSYVLSNGTVLTAGLGQVNHRFKSFTFGNNANFAEAPVVLAQIMTNNEQVAATARLATVTSNGFSMRVQEEQAADRIHALETVGWIAIKKVQITQNGIDIEVGRTPVVVTHITYPIDFQTTFTAAPAFFAQMQTYLGGDPATVRHNGLSSRTAKIFLEEERSFDMEVEHNPESVGFLAMKPGILTALPIEGGPQFMRPMSFQKPNDPQRMPPASNLKQAGTSASSRLVGSSYMLVGSSISIGSGNLSTGLKSNSPAAGDRANLAIQTGSVTSKGSMSSLSYKQRADVFAELYGTKSASNSVVGIDSIHKVNTL